jgi:outer membrane protein OmpA-like peptidoglycan-associated protein
MLRASLPVTGAALLAVLAIALPSPAPAQSDPAALQLIEQLRPRTRGIRLPAPADAAAPTPPTVIEPAAAPAVQPIIPTAPPAMPVAVSPAPLAPAPIISPPPMAAPAASPAPARPAPPPAISTATTAPAGVPAVSITVTFPSGSATLTPQAEATLAPLGRALASAELSPFRFRIEGHTDSVGDATYNMRLSERRAASVRGYLMMKHGVTAARLEAVGLGETRLLVPTPDNVDEPRNRRVQIINLDG